MTFHVSRQAAASSLALAMAAPFACAESASIATPIDTVVVTAARTPQRPNEAAFYTDQVFNIDV